MAHEPDTGSTAWARAQIAQYRALRGDYQTYARVLYEILSQAADGRVSVGFVQTRCKSVPSFAEKIQRKRHKYPDPVNQITDLCGGRVITHTYPEVEVMSAYIEEHFAVDRANSVDVSSRLKPTEFGYRSVHYVVQFRPGVYPTDDVRVEVPASLYPRPTHPMKAEIQVRTLLEHAWASFSHERVYKGAYTIPDLWQRELAGLAAMLEEADGEFARIQAGLQTYAASYGAYMSPAEMRREMDLLQLVLDCDPEDVRLAHRIARLAIALGDWQTAVDILSPYAASGDQPVLRDLGMALCKLHGDDPACPAYLRGQQLLERACASSHRDVDALASLAGTYKARAPDRARALYRQAFELDPTDPYAVENYLTAEIAYRGDTSAVPLMAPSIEAAMRRCQEQADVGVNLPWAYYSLGMFHLLRGQPYESLYAYALAVQVSSSSWMLGTALRNLELLAAATQDLPGYAWVQRWLWIGAAARFPTPAALDRVRALAKAPPIAGPVVIVSGGTDAGVQPQMEGYRDMLLQAFQDYAGAVLSGGTRAGVPGLVGDVQEAHPARIRAIGYVPTSMPPGVTTDPRYREIRVTGGGDFSPLEALQYWIDLIASGIQAAQVKLLGINGGAISGAEYRMALSLGARVALVAGSGREADALLGDRRWQDAPRLIRLPADGAAARAYVGHGGAALPAARREALARLVHETQRTLHVERVARLDPTLAPWDDLAEAYRESSRQRVDHIVDRLTQVGYAVRPAGTTHREAVALAEGEVEQLAELAHQRWVAEQRLDGWTYGPQRDLARKTSPYLVSWAELPEEVQEGDRATVRAVPALLAQAGLDLIRVPTREHRDQRPT
ncbi:MAG: hypothetical protein JXA09_18275 [Anaerolineae bacterium]|nr:hypothetical protein [Anaerolineae bacterium]